MEPLNQEQVDFLSHQIKTGKSIPGQSLTNSPENPYNWEKPPEFTNIQEASHAVFNTIFDPQVAGNLLLSINNNVGVIDLTSMILSKYLQRGEKKLYEKKLLRELMKMLFLKN